MFDNKVRTVISTVIFSTIAVLFTIFSGCEESPKTPVSSSVVEIEIRGLSFEAPDEIPSGWVTFRVVNESDMTHMGLLEKMPDGKGIKEQQAEIAPIFQQGMDLIVAGDGDAAMAKFGELPEWFGQIKYSGGPGLVAGGRTSETTVYLEPGRYLLECYVKTDGIFHSYNPNGSNYGMVHEFRVTDEIAPQREPDPTLEIMLSAEKGIEATNLVSAGRHIVAVHFGDQTVHENFLGHDLHVVRLDDDSIVERLSEWMDWSRPDGLQTPSPVQFYGGTQEMAAGSTAYITVDLEPGTYAWVSEVTSAADKNMLKLFTVTN